MIGRLTKELITMITSRNTRISAAIAAGAAAVSIVTLAGCGSSAPAPSAPGGSSNPVATAPAQAAHPVNPVPILRQAGFTPDKGEVYGHAWIGGLEAEATVRDAHGQNTENITVYTTGDQASFDQEQAQNTPGDDLGVVTIPGKLTTILVQTYPDDITPPQPAQKTATQIAQRVHGLVIEPQA
jgi:hypothetical protein